MDKNELLHKIIKDFKNVSREEFFKELEESGIEYTNGKSNVYVRDGNELKIEEKEATIIKVNGSEIKLVWEE